MLQSGYKTLSQQLVVDIIMKLQAEFVKFALDYDAAVVLGHVAITVIYTTKRVIILAFLSPANIPRSSKQLDHKI